MIACVDELVMPERFAGVFSHDPAVVAEGARYLRIAALSQLGICAEIVLEGALGGAGATLPPMLTSTVITASRIPLAAWASARWGIEGLWWTISHHGAAARRRDDGHLARGALEAELDRVAPRRRPFASCSRWTARREDRCHASSLCSPISAPRTATWAR